MKLMVAIACTLFAAAPPANAAQDAEATAHFRGLALDAITGEPLAHSSVMVIGPGGSSEVCTTDADGRFATEAEFREGRMEVCSYDNRERRDLYGMDSMRFFFQHPRGDLTGTTYVPVRLFAGPRVELDFVPPPGRGLADYHVEVRRAAETPGGPRGMLNSALLHEGAYPWVRPRFQRPPWRSAVLFVLANDGLSATRIPLPDRFDGPLTVILEPRGVLAGRIEESVSTPRPVYACDGSSVGYDSPHVHAGITLLFTPIGADAEHREAIRAHAPIGRDFRVPWIPPGRWEVALLTRYYPDQRHEILVEPGVAVPFAARLGDPVATGELRIRISDPSGDLPVWKGSRDAPDFSAIVTGKGETRGRFTIETSAWCGVGIDYWFEPAEHEGRQVLEAVIPDAPMGEYRVALVSRETLIAPRAATIRPGETASFVLARGDPSGGYGFRVRANDASCSQGFVDRYYSILPVSRSDDFALSRHAIANGLHAFSLPEDDEVAWCLHLGNYKRVYGDRSDFIAAADGHWSLVDLEPGYSIRLVATFEDGAPAPGVAVRFGGAEFVTDESGVVLLECDDRNPELRLDIEGKAPVAGDLNAAGEFPRGLPDLRVTLSR